MGVVGRVLFNKFRKSWVSLGDSNLSQYNFAFYSRKNLDVTPNYHWSHTFFKLNLVDFERTQKNIWWKFWLRILSGWQKYGLILVMYSKTIPHFLLFPDEIKASQVSLFGIIGEYVVLRWHFRSHRRTLCNQISIFNSSYLPFGNKCRSQNWLIIAFGALNLKGWEFCWTGNKTIYYKILSSKFRWVWYCIEQNSQLKFTFAK